MWWRRHSSLWPRSFHPGRIVHDTDSLLRSTENLLRSSRTFSKSPSTPQQKHVREDVDVEDKHSPGNFHVDYRKWKREMERRMVEDPYKMLFGASEQRLKGLGFGGGWLELGMGWMEKDAADKDKAPVMKAAEKAEIPDTSRFERHMPPFSKKPIPESKTYPRKVNISTDDSFTIRGPIKLGRLESSAGVTSPSDPRRLHQQPEHNLNDPRIYQIEGYNVSAETFANFTDWQNKQRANQDRLEEQEWMAETATRKKGNQDLYRYKGEEAEVKNALVEEEKSVVVKMEAIARETELISESLNDSSVRTPSAQASAATQDSIDSKEWKRTALDRRAGNTFAPPSRADFTSAIRARQKGIAALHNNMPTKIRVDPTTTAMESDVLSDIKKDDASANIPDTQSPLPGARFWHYMSEQSQLLDDIAKGRHTSKAAAQEETFTWLDGTKAQKTDIENSRKPALTRSTSEVLGQLPKDDIDFLSAAEIRAAMGVKKEQEEAAKSRAELEKDFREAHTKEMELDSMIESQIVNDKHIRRLERELKEKQEAKATANETASSESILETSLNNLTKMIQDGGECLTKYLWTDPVDTNETTTAPTTRPRDPMLSSIIQTLRQNRETMSEISQDLGDDIPATKRLLKGLKDFESRAIGSVVSLARYRTVSEKALEAKLIKRHDDALESLKLVNYRGEMYKEIEQAWRAIDSMTTLKLSKDMHERLQVAETMLEESAESTHTMWRSLIQANLYTSNSPEPLWKIMLYHIRAVSDLQNSLLKVIQRFMLHFNVPLKQKQQTLFSVRSFSGKAPETMTEECITPNTSNKLSAAKQNLEVEIQAQKDAMRGLSDDGYRRALKPASASASVFALAPAPAPVKKKTLDELKPLANSLFRPFGLQLEGLGKEEKAVAEERKSETQKVKEQACEQTTAENRAAAKPSSTEHIVNLFLREPEVETPKTKGEAFANASTSVDGSDVFTLEDQNEEIAGKSQTKSPVVPEREPDAPVVDLSEPKTAPASSTQVSPEEPVVKSAPTPYISLASNVPETARKALLPLPPPPTIYKILTYNPTTDELSITTTTSVLDTATTAVPLPEALLTLDHPGKFVPHIPEGFEIAKTRNDMLIMRSSAGAKLQTETVRYSTIASKPISEPAALTPRSATEEINGHFVPDPEHLKRQHNSFGVDRYLVDKDSLPVLSPLSGGLRLGPKQRGKDTSKIMEELTGIRRDAMRDIRRKRGVGLVKTVVWAGAGCYALGVLGELLA